MSESTEPSMFAAVREAIVAVAPDIEPEEVELDTDLIDDLDLDSMDLLNIVAAIHAATGIDIPEREQAGLETVGSVVDFLRGSAT